MRYIFLILFLTFAPIYGISNDTSAYNLIEKNVYFPNRKIPISYHHGLGFSFLSLPKDWLETSLIAPMIDYRGIFYMDYGFQLEGDVQTIFVANRIALGPAWNLKLNDWWYLGMGYQFSYNFGFLNNFGFNNVLHVTMNDINASMGFKINDLLLTLAFKAEFVNKFNLRAGKVVYDQVPSFYNGYTAGFYLEQRLYKNKSFTFGFNMHRYKFHILGWPALYESKKFYLIPEISALFNF